MNCCVTSRLIRLRLTQAALVLGGISQAAAKGTPPQRTGKATGAGTHAVMLKGDDLRQSASRDAALSAIEMAGLGAASTATPIHSTR
jgi:hypothetical protein